MKLLLASLLLSGATSNSDSVALTGDCYDLADDEVVDVVGDLFPSCAAGATMGFCSEEVALILMVDDLDMSICCESCAALEGKCLDADALIANFNIPNLDTCLAASALMPLCDDDSMISTLATSAGLNIDWIPGSFAKLCCATCNPPVAFVMVEIPGSMSLTVEIVPEESSAEFRVMVVGLTIALEATTGGTVEVTGFAGVNLAGEDRRLADVNVEFIVMVRSTLTYNPNHTSLKR